MDSPVTLGMLKALTTALGGTPEVNAISRHETQRAVLPAPPETPKELSRLRDALSFMSPDVERGEGRIFYEGQICSGYWLGVVWAIAGLGWDSGEEIAREWSRPSERYSDEGFDEAWSSFDKNHRTPTGIGSVFKLAQLKGWSDSPFSVVEGYSREDDQLETKAGQTDEGSNSPLAAMEKFSVTGSSRQLKEKMLADAFVMQDIAILGQWTTLYAAPNTGKTLLSLWLLREQIVAGVIDANKVFYVNADDNYRGMVTKVEIAEEFGMKMLVPNLNDFDVREIRHLMRDFAQTGEAQGVVIVLDTLKKFTDLMDKSASTAFGTVARGFVSAGGTLITLAHTNKHPDAEGRGIYSGTSDIVDDCDCTYIIDQISVAESPFSSIQTVEFTNKKCRGDVATTLGFNFEKKTGGEYLSLLDSVTRISAGEIDDANRSAAIRDGLEEDDEIIAAVCSAISTGITTKAKIVKAVTESTAETNNRVKRVLERRTGENYAKGHRWQCRQGDHNAQVYSVLPPLSISI